MGRAQSEGSGEDSLNRRGFLGLMIGGVAATAAVRTFPFRIFSFPREIVLPPLGTFPFDGLLEFWENETASVRSEPIFSEPFRMLSVLAKGDFRFKDAETAEQIALMTGQADGFFALRDASMKSLIRVTNELLGETRIAL